MAQRQIIILAIVSLVALFSFECINAQMSPEEMAKMQMPDLSNDTCAVHTNCLDCLKNKGCNYCQKAGGTSFCTQITNAADALCIVPGCSADTFIQSLAMCSGGCRKEYDCYDCSRTPGCGWCQSRAAEGAEGCMEAVDFVNPAEKCREPDSIWEMGEKNCYVICENRLGRKNCMEPSQACLWNGTSEQCSTSPTGVAMETFPPTEAPTKSDTKVNVNVNAPPGDSRISSESQSRQGNFALWFVLGVGAAVGVLIFKKLRVN